MCKCAQNVTTQLYLVRLRVLIQHLALRNYWINRINIDMKLKWKLKINILIIFNVTKYRDHFIQTFSPPWRNAFQWVCIVSMKTCKSLESVRTISNIRSIYTLCILDWKNIVKFWPREIDPRFRMRQLMLWTLLGEWTIGLFRIDEYLHRGYKQTSKVLVK